MCKGKGPKLVVNTSINFDLYTSVHVLKVEKDVDSCERIQGHQQQQQKNSSESVSSSETVTILC